jgi:5-amino-6-(5-phosphoribosylamino)uracil reductase
MAERPYTTLSAAVSLDGYLDDATAERLVLSTSADLDRVDEVRAESDAILVGATTVRRDDPRLLVRDASRRAARTAQGRCATPLKVTVTRSGVLPSSSAFFADDGAEKVVYAATRCVDALRRTVPDATVVDVGAEPCMSLVGEDLAARGVRRLLVEGGSEVLTQFLLAGLADELHLVIAPFLVGDSGGTRFIGDGAFPWTSTNRAHLLEVRQIDDLVLLRYSLTR